jgi:polyisoprenoid-binding protein YceI
MLTRLRPPAVLLLLALTAVPAEVYGTQESPGPDSTVYQLDPASRLVVKTGKAGLLGFAGHPHVIQAHAVRGELVYRPGRAASSLHLTLPTDSLQVLTPPDTEEIRKVTESMRTEVLHVDRYPEMRFAAESLDARSGKMSFPLLVTMAGTTRRVPVTAEVAIGPDSIRAVGTFSAKQTDFGIEPYSGGPGGTVKVADKVTFCFELIGRRDAGTQGRRVEEGDPRAVPGCEDMPRAKEKEKRPM